jgi:hypothetical protein
MKRYDIKGEKNEVYLKRASSAYGPDQWLEHGCGYCAKKVKNFPTETCAVEESHQHEGSIVIVLPPKELVYDVSINQENGEILHREQGTEQWIEGYPQLSAFAKAYKKLRTQYKSWKDLQLVLNELDKLQQEKVRKINTLYL